MQIDQFERAVEAGWSTAVRGDERPTVEHFAALLERYPDDPRALFEAACAYDWGGRPDDAAPLYERAFAAGLTGDRLRRAMLQYGSTLRNLDRAAEAVAVLERARVRYPDSDAVRAFLALALRDADRADDAIADLLDLALDRIESADFTRYQWALRHYAAALRRGYWSSADDDGR